MIQNTIIRTGFNFMNTPNGYKEIVAMFGDPHQKDYESKNIVLFDLPYPLLYNGKAVFKTRCHKLMVNVFQSVLTDIKAMGLESLVKNYGGIYENRNIRGVNQVSCHAFGIAIDLEPVKYPLGSLKRFPQPVVDIFKKHGFVYGGDFKNRKDAMHFQYATGY